MVTISSDKGLALALADAPSGIAPMHLHVFEHRAPSAHGRSRENHGASGRGTNHGSGRRDSPHSKGFAGGLSQSEEEAVAIEKKAREDQINEQRRTKKTQVRLFLCHCCCLSLHWHE